MTTFERTPKFISTWAARSCCRHEYHVPISLRSDARTERSILFSEWGLNGNQGLSAGRQLETVEDYTEVGLTVVADLGPRASGLRPQASCVCIGPCATWFSAAKRRENVAHGVSRGCDAGRRRAPKGRKRTKNPTNRLTLWRRSFRPFGAGKFLPSDPRLTPWATFWAPLRG